MSKPIVFLSHSSKDRKQLTALRELLLKKTQGTVDFFLSSDGESISLGRNWIASIQRSLDQAKLAFLFLTPSSLSSTWVPFEAGYMHSKDISVTPVALPGVEMGRVPQPLSLLQGFNLHSHEAMNNLLEKLNKELGMQFQHSFTKNEFDQVFGNEAPGSEGFFGKYSDYLSHLESSGYGTPTITAALDEELKPLKLHLRALDDQMRAACPGLELEFTNDNNGACYKIRVYRDLVPQVFLKLVPILERTAKPPFTLSLKFIRGVGTTGSGVEWTARAFGTKLEVHPYGFLFGQHTVHLAGSINVLGQSLATASELKELVTTVFDSELLNYDPTRPQPLDFWSQRGLAV